MSHGENARLSRAFLPKVTRVTFGQGFAGVTFDPPTKSELSGVLFRQESL
jgi:hypothetical protein